VLEYDKLHVNAWLAWLDAKTLENSEGSLTAIPTLFGGNFQVINVAQKTVGYLNTTGNPFSPAILKGLDFVDDSLGSLVQKLKAKKIYDDTLIVIASKHGQAPIDPTLYKKIDPKTITNLTKVSVLSQTSDDIALLFLNNSADTKTAAANLRAGAAKGEIASVIAGEEIKAAGYGDPAKDPSVPDIIVQPNLGVIYTNSKTKIAEHGGFSTEDRKVACFVSNPKLKKRQFMERVYTTQVGPTILNALGIDPNELEGVKVEATKVLPGFK
jgi:arylsulfatase A-like enzyme